MRHQSFLCCHLMHRISLVTFTLFLKRLTKARLENPPPANFVHRFHAMDSSKLSPDLFKIYMTQKLAFTLSVNKALAAEAINVIVDAGIRSAHQTVQHREIQVGHFRYHWIPLTMISVKTNT